MGNGPDETTASINRAGLGGTDELSLTSNRDSVRYGAQRRQFLMSDRGAFAFRLFLQELLQFRDCARGVMFLRIRARGHLMSEGVRSGKRMRFAAGRDDSIEVPVHEFRVGQQHQRHRIRGIERRSFVQRGFCARKISRRDIHAAEVDVGGREVVVDADRLLQRLALASTIAEARVDDSKIVVGPGVCRIDCDRRVQALNRFDKVLPIDELVRLVEFFLGFGWNAQICRGDERIRSSAARGPRLVNAPHFHLKLRRESGWRDDVVGVRQILARNI